MKKTGEPKSGTAAPDFFCEQCVARHSQWHHFAAKRDSRGGRFIHGVQAETTEIPLIMIWKRPQDDTTWGRFFLLPSSHVQRPPLPPTMDGAQTRVPGSRRRQHPLSLGISPDRRGFRGLHGLVFH